jgi:hypothetical protein
MICGEKSVVCRVMLNKSFRTEALLHVTVHPRKCLIWLDSLGLEFALGN